jgi:cystathionine beta-lyase
MDLSIPQELRDPQGYSYKWHRYPEGVLPLWVADMDFPPASELLAALHERLNHWLGYPQPGGDPGLVEALLADLAARGWPAYAPEGLWFLPGVVPGLYAGVLGLSSPGDEVLTQVPIYPPFLSAIRDYGRAPVYNPLVLRKRWELDLEDLEARITPATRVLLFCNPHNPTGRVWSRKELEALGELVLRHQLWVISDELHSPLVLEGVHTPFASLDPEVSQRTLTLVGPCKAYNTAGLGIGAALSENLRLLERVKAAARGLIGNPNVLSMAMWQAGLERGGTWLAEVLAYLKRNRDLMADFLRTHLPEVGFVPPEGTYLAWLDFRAFHKPSIVDFLLQEARVGLNDGPTFGPGGEGFVRLNFATNQDLLTEALQRIERALRKPSGP